MVVFPLGFLVSQGGARGGQKKNTSEAHPRPRKLVLLETSPPFWAANGVDGWLGASTLRHGIHTKSLGLSQPL